MSLPSIECIYLTEESIEELKISNPNFKFSSPAPVRRFLYELCWTVVRGDLPLDKCKVALEAVEFSDCGPEEDVGSYFADAVAQIAQELSVAGDFRSRLIKLAKWLVKSALVPLRYFQERCEDEFLRESEMLNVKASDLKSGNFSSARESSMADDYESLISTTDAELLKRAWRNEKASPEILKFEAALIQRSRQQIQLMEETVEDFNKNGYDPLTVSLYQMDLDRTLFLLRSYLRTRLQKIEKYVFHIQRTAELWNRLSKQEQRFAKRGSEDLKHHLEQSVLLKLPNQYQSHLKQSSATEEDDMISMPQLDTYVICRSKRFLGAVLLDDGGEEPVNIEADDLYALPYKAIYPLVESGQIDLV